MIGTIDSCGEDRRFGSRLLPEQVSRELREGKDHSKLDRWIVLNLSICNQKVTYSTSFPDPITALAQCS